jgi:hypothetical protein
LAFCISGLRTGESLFLGLFHARSEGRGKSWNTEKLKWKKVCSGQLADSNSELRMANARRLFLVLCSWFFVEGGSGEFSGGAFFVRCSWLAQWVELVF